MSSKSHGNRSKLFTEQLEPRLMFSNLPLASATVDVQVDRPSVIESCELDQPCIDSAKNVRLPRRNPTAHGDPGWNGPGGPSSPVAHGDPGWKNIRGMTYKAPRADSRSVAPTKAEATLEKASPSRPSGPTEAHDRVFDALERASKNLDLTVVVDLLGSQVRATSSNCALYLAHLFGDRPEPHSEFSWDEWWDDLRAWRNSPRNTGDHQVSSSNPALLVLSDA